MSGSSQDNGGLFIQVERDIGMLISILKKCQMSNAERLTFEHIVVRMEDSLKRLRPILYPESLRKKEAVTIQPVRRNS